MKLGESPIDDNPIPIGTVCIVEKNNYHYFREYLLSLEVEIRFFPCLINKGEKIIVVQKLLDLNYENASWIGLLNTEQISRKEWYSYFQDYLMKSNLPLNFFDYSASNIKLLKEKMSITSTYLPYKYRKEEIEHLKFLINNTPKYYDAAFIGCGDRRDRILNSIKGISINKIVGKWDDDRDLEVAKCKILINIHFSEDYKIFEEIRCTRWMMAGMKVISERCLYENEIGYKTNLILTDNLNQSILDILNKNKMKIGVAIPCCKKDILFLNRCLRSIENQTQKPDLVSISISECDENDIKNINRNYSFPLKITASINKQNASMNRNIAGNLLKEMDIISFIDSDDEMYPERLQYLKKAFSENDVDFVLHNYIIYKSFDESLLYRNVKTQYNFFGNSVLPNPHHCGVIVNPIYVPNNNCIISHGHVTIKKTIFENEKFKTEDHYIRWEDSEYCRRLTDKMFKGGYLYNELTKYHDYIETPIDLETIRNIEKIHSKNICIATYTDFKYLDRAKKTINDIRTTGNFNGDIVVMTDGLFQIHNEYINSMKIKVKEYPDIDVKNLIEKIKKHPFINTDKREYEKTKQWNKLYAFDIYFKQYDYVMFVDAGLRIFDDIQNFFSSFIDHRLVAPNDGYPDYTKKFNCQIEMSNIEIINKLKEIYDIDSDYFLNCIFLYDTNIIENDTLSNLIKLMNEYPICRTNEMGVMNIYFHKKWKPMDIQVGNKILFDWSERDGKDYNKYISLKYSRTTNL